MTAGLVALVALIWAAIAIAATLRRSPVPYTGRGIAGWWRHPYVQAGAVVVAASALVVATTLSSIGRPPVDVLIASVVAGAAVAGFLGLTRWVVGPGLAPGAPMAAALLTVLGVVTAERLGGEGSGEGLSQAGAAGLAALLFLLVVAVVRKRLGWGGPAAAVVTLGCLFALVLPLTPLGDPVGGVHLAVSIGPLRGQPSEVVRPLVVVVLAAGIAAAAPHMRHSRRPLRDAALAVAVPLGGVVGLLAIASDYGPILVLGVTTVVLLLLVRPAPRITAVVVLVPVVLAGLLVAASGTVRERIADMLQPVEPRGLNNVGLGLRALARGGWIGTGVGDGNPTAVTYVESDFVMTAIGEERGALGVIVVLVLCFLLVRSLLLGAGRATGEPAQLVAVGMALLVAVQVVYTTLGVYGVVPLTGLAVPFLSLGSSALIGMWLAVGVAVGLAAGTVHRKDVPSRPRVALVGSTVAGALTLVAVLLVAVNPPVPPGNTIAHDWAARRGAVLAADGTVLGFTAPGATGRSYPGGALYGDVVGYTLPGAGEGLEETARDRYSCANAWWQALIGATCVPPDLVTTIVPAVQEAAAVALDGMTGDVVVLDVHTGDVLAAYSTGPPDPAELVGPRGADLRDRLAADPRHDEGAPFSTYATSPGSVFKLVIGSAAVRAGVDTETTRRARYQPPGGTYTVTNAGDATLGGSLEQALAASSNTSFAEIAGRVGEDAIRREADLLTSWAQLPGGAVSPPATIGPDALTPAGLARTGFGQEGVRATPLALAVLAAEIATGGEQVAPRFTAGTCDGGFSPGPVAEPVRVIAEPAAARLQQAMELAVDDGRVLALRELPVPAAAKTGTADRGDKVFDGLVVAYAPAADPQYAIAVRTEGDDQARISRAGGADAGPIAAAVLSAALSADVDSAAACRG